MVNRALRLKNFHLGKRGAQGKSHHRTDFHLASANYLGRLRNIPGIDANGRESIGERFLAEFLDFVARRVGLQECVVDEARDFSGS
jgi:hypothetical protein